MSKKIHHSKKWIDPRTTGYIFTEVEHDYNYNATLKIGDCSRIVSLDVYCDDKQAQRKTIRKLDLIVREITALRDAIAGIKYE